MKYFKDVSRTPDPSYTGPPPAPKEKFILPPDEEAELMIDVEGMTTDELIDMCFQGIDLMSYSGEAFSRTFLAATINSAIATAEQTFDICITPRTIENELHDYEGRGMNDFEYTALFWRPIKTIHSMKYMYGNRNLMEIPKDWIQVDRLQGEITLFPTSGSYQIIQPAQGMMLPYFMARSYLPMAKSISYEAGMEKKDIPANLLEFIYKKAAISIFEVWGDQIIGAGIASSSLSIDGLSQSIGTTQSAMYGGASARILEYRKDLEEVLPVLRRHFARMAMTVL